MTIGAAAARHYARKGSSKRGYLAASLRTGDLHLLLHFSPALRNDEGDASVYIFARTAIANYTAHQ